MLTIDDLHNIAAEANRTPPYDDPRWPPSVYYRFLALALKKIGGTAAVELGTAGAGACLTMAHLNPQATIVSIDVDRLPQAQAAADLFPNLILHRGDSVALAPTLGQTHGPLDLLFIDTTHEYEQTQSEYNAWRPYVKPGGLICFDDLFRPGTAQFWNELPGVKVRLDAMHIGGSPTDGGFGVLVRE